MLRLEPRARASRPMLLGAPLIALLATVMVSALLFVLLGFDPVTTLVTFFTAPLTSLNGLSEWLLKASPLILIGLGLSVGFRANVWNIGAEGMFIIGAIAAGGVALRFGESAPVWLLPAMLLAGAAGGMAWAAIAALLKTWGHTSEILVTLMLNYVAELLLSWLVNGPWRDPEGFNYPQSAPFAPGALFAPFSDSVRLNGSIFITLAALPLFWLLQNRSFIGFRLGVSGVAPAAAAYAGYSRAGAVWFCLLLSGATAGLAGMMEVAGPLGQLTPVLSPGYGYIAIIVAFIGRLDVAGVVLGGLLLSLLTLGGEQLQLTLALPSSLTRSFQGLLLFFLLAVDVLIHHRLRWRRS